MSKDSAIHPHGYWMMRNKRYTFDKGLARGIVEFAREKGVKDVIDVGCGNGAYVFYLRDKGFEADGFDGNPYTSDITHGECMVCDFAEPVLLWARDLVLCLEVAEHIPEDKEWIFLDNILAPMSDYIIISWAVEGQGGVGHVNCRNNDYVQHVFGDWKYGLDAEWTRRLRALCSVSWFKKTLMVYERLGGCSDDV